MRVVTTGLLLAAALLPGCVQAQDGPSSGGRPANLCRELVAFVHQPEPASSAAQAPPQLATAVTAAPSGGAPAQPSAPGTPQNSSGQSGQITASGPGAAGPQGASQNRAAPAGATATTSGPAADAPAAARPSPETVQRVEGAAADNDLRACRAAAQSMRRAGIVMPGPLLALAAMAPNLLDGAAHP